MINDINVEFNNISMIFYNDVKAKLVFEFSSTSYTLYSSNTFACFFIFLLNFLLLLIYQPTNTELRKDCKKIIMIKI